MITLAFVIMAMPWMMRNQSLGLQSRYIETVTQKNIWNPEAGKLTTWDDWKEKLTKNTYDTIVRAALEVTVPYNFPLTRETWVWTLGTLLLCFVFWGLYKAGPLGHLCMLILLANGTILLLWHEGNFSRYVWPLAPFFYLGLVNATLETAKWTSAKLQIPYTSAFVFILLASGFFMKSKADLFRLEALSPRNEGMKTYINFADTVKARNVQDAMVICRKPLIFNYHSGASTSSFPFTSDSMAMLSHLVSKSTDFIILDNMGYNSAHKYLTPFLNRNRELWSLEVKANPDSYLIRWRKDLAEKKLQYWRETTPDSSVVEEN